MISKDKAHRILNIKKDASRSEIKRAYRTLVKECHPDVNPDDPASEERFKEIQQAYDSLINGESIPDQKTENQWDNNLYSAVQDHPFHSLRDRVIKYYSDRGWFNDRHHGKTEE